jgi:hypothetical protein
MLANSKKNCIFANSIETRTEMRKLIQSSTLSARTEIGGKNSANYLIINVLPPPINAYKSSSYAFLHNFNALYQWDKGFCQTK